MKQIWTILLLMTFNSGVTFGQLTIGEIYDFEVGDAFQYQYEWYAGYSSFHIKLIDKRFSARKDTVFYSWHKVTYSEGQYTFDTVETKYTNLDDTMMTVMLRDEIHIKDDSLKKYYQFLPSEKWRDDTTLKTRGFIDTTLEFELSGKQFWTVGYHVKYGPISFENSSARKVCGKGIGDCIHGKISGQPNDYYYTELVYIEKGNKVYGNKVVSLNEPVKKEEKTIYPNPTTGIINFNEPDEKNVSIYDLSGKLLFTEIVEYSFDISTLDIGSYIMSLTTDNKQLIKRIIKI